MDLLIRIWSVMRIGNGRTYLLKIKLRWTREVTCHHVPIKRSSQTHLILRIACQLVSSTKNPTVCGLVTAVRHSIVPRYPRLSGRAVFVGAVAVFVAAVGAARFSYTAPTKTPLFFFSIYFRHQCTLSAVLRF